METSKNNNSFITFDREIFLRIIDSTTKFCSQDRKSGVLQDVEIKLKKDLLSFISTDGDRFTILKFHRLKKSVHNKINWDNFKFKENLSVLINRWCLWKVKDCLIGWNNVEREFLNEPVDAKSVKLCFANNGEISCLVDGKSVGLSADYDYKDFPNMEDILPLRFANNVSFNKFDLYKKLSNLRNNYGSYNVQIIVKNKSNFAEIYMNIKDRFSGSASLLKEKPDLLKNFYAFTLDIDFALEGLEIFSEHYVSMKFNSSFEVIVFQSNIEDIEFLHGFLPEKD